MNFLRMFDSFLIIAPTVKDEDRNIKLDMADLAAALGPSGIGRGAAH